MEGIKPTLDKSNDEIGSLEYKIEEGIFKQICKSASYIQKEFNGLPINTNNRVWKISLGSKNWKVTPEIQEYCFENNEIRIGWGDASINDETLKELGKNEQCSVRYFKNSMQIGDLVCVLNSVKTIKTIGIIESEFNFDEESPLVKKLQNFYSFRKVKWIDQSIINILSLNNGTPLDQRTVYLLKRISPFDLLSLSQNRQDKNMIDNTQKNPTFSSLTRLIGGM